MQVYPWDERLFRYHMYIAREDDKNTFNYVDFSRLHNVILGFTALSPKFFTSGIVLLCKIVKEPRNRETLLLNV